ncbi:hypothetical protein Tco_0996821 [Tanacetum coccineum]
MLNGTPLFYSSNQQQQFECCEIYGGPHYSSDCQPGTRLSMSLIIVTIMTCLILTKPTTIPLLIYRPPGSRFECHFKLIQRETNVYFEELLRTLKPNPLVDEEEPEGSDDYIEVPFDDEQIQRQHYIAQVTPPAYTSSLPFLTTMEPADAFLMGDEVISNTPAKENDKIIKSSVDNLVLIPRESEVTLYNNLECDMPVNIPLPTTDVREEKSDINSPLGEHVVDFLMEIEDISDLPRHLVKQLFSYLVKHPSSTKRMSDEPLGNPDSVSRSLETSDLNLEELTTEIGLDDSISTKIDDGYYDSEGDILFLEHLLIEETFSDLTPIVLPKKSTILVTPPPASKQFSLKEVERFDPFFP